MAQKANLKDINLFLLYDIFRYLDCISIVNIRCTSKQNAVLACEVIAKSPAVITALFNGSSKDVLSLLYKVQSPPNVVIITDCTAGSWRAEDISLALLPYLPKNVNIIYSQNYSVQAACLNGIGDVCYFTDENGTDEESSAYSIMFGAFPDAICTTFLLRDEDLYASDGMLTTESLLQAGMQDPDQDWKVFVIYSSEFEHCDPVVIALQRRYPTAAILGGLTGGRVGVSRGGVMVHTTEGGLACLAMRGNVPLKVVVSRGVEAASGEYLVLPEDIYTPRQLRSAVHSSLAIGRLYEADESGMQASSAVTSIETETEEESRAWLSPEEVISRVISRVNQMISPTMMLLGLRTTRAEPFYLVPISPHPVRNGRLLVGLDPYMEPPTSLCFFALTPQACRQDVAACLQLTKKRLDDDGEVPNEMFSVDQADARAYISVFPDVPLIGSYMSGEIGPHAGAGVTSETVLRSGTATVQGFTAVFGVFAVPKPKSARDALQSLTSRGDALDFSTILASYRSH